MIFPVDHIIWHLTQFAELRPGDLILTGTPDGVGLGRKPPVFLKDGDVIDLEVQQVGSSAQRGQDSGSTALVQAAGAVGHSRSPLTAVQGIAARPRESAVKKPRD
jgi:fumarylacetoacetase-like protein